MSSYEKELKRVIDDISNSSDLELFDTDKFFVSEAVIESIFSDDSEINYSEREMDVIIDKIADIVYRN